VVVSGEVIEGMEEGSSYNEEEEGEVGEHYDQAINWDLDTLDFNFASGNRSV
jgi:hypothetical protein